jgi:hypothetical protein
MSERTQAIVDWFSGAPLRVISVLLIALISHTIGKRAIERAVAKLASADIKPGPGVVARQAERARTIGTVLTSTFNAFVWIIAIGMILGEFGFDLGPVRRPWLKMCSLESLCWLKINTELAIK